MGCPAQADADITLSVRQLVGIFEMIGFLHGNPILFVQIKSALFRYGDLVSVLCLMVEVALPPAVAAVVWKFMQIIPQLVQGLRFVAARRGLDASLAT